MDNNNKKKDDLLGIPHGTANHQLRKMILFKCVQKLGEDICYRCNRKIESIEDFSIEHKIAWQQSENPKETFFDLDNISFSHLNCNTAARERGVPHLTQRGENNSQSKLTCKQVKEIKQELEKGTPTQDALDWYAQDAKGNVWHFGEEAKSFCDRNNPDLVCGTVGSWKAGVNGAEPGIVMLAAPSPGDYYRQEYAADAHDLAKVLRLNADVKLSPDDPIDPDHYTGCVITKEWSPLEPEVIDHKFYCPGTGLVLINELHSGTARTELVAVAQE